MRIVNFNATIDLWNAWKKNYIDDLNIKITSLWNHMMYKNPPYRILNSVTDSNSINLDDKGYRYTINNETMHVYIPSKLQYHQGFYNNSDYGDAVLGYEQADGTICPITEGAFDSFKKEEKSTTIYKYDFKAGYCCISNIQPEGINNESNPLRHKIENYLIYPLGSGSFYNIYPYASKVYASYRKNEDGGSFANTILFHPYSSLRYTISTENDEINPNGFWSSLNATINNQNEITLQIKDVNNLMWCGGEDLVSEIYQGNEMVFCDSKHNIEEVVEQSTILHRASVVSNIKITGYTVRVY